MKVKDSNVKNVIQSYIERSQKGEREYGVTTEREDYSLLDWLNELQAELMDATIYIEQLKKKVESLEDIINGK